MTAQAKYITSVIETFSTYLESLNVSSQLNEETTALFIKFLKQKENYDSWPMHTLEKFLETEKPSSNAVVLIKRFVKDFTPYQTDIFLHKFLSELKAENKSASTIKNYRSDISGMISLVGVNKIADLFTRKNVKSFVKDQFAKNLKVGTVKRKLVSITQFAEWAESKGLVKNVSFWIGDVEGLFENSGKDGYKQKTASKETGFCKPTSLPLGKLDNLDISLTKNSNLSSDNPFRGDVEIGGIEPKDATTLLEEFLVNLEINGSSKSTVKNYKSDISQLVNFVDQKLDRKVGNKTKTTSEEVGFCKPTSLPLGRLDKSELSITRNINLSIINSNKGDVEIGGIEPPRLDLSSQPGKPAIPTSRGNISQINKQIKPKTYPLVLIITQENLREFVAFQTSKGLKQNSIKRKLVSISQFSAWAEQRGELKNTSLWMNAVQNNKPYLHNIELKLKKQTKSNRWSLPMPGFVKNKTGIGTRLGITNHKTKEGSHDYASRLKESLKDFATSINAKKNKTFLPYFNLVMIALFLLGVGYFGYQQFVKQAPDSLAYPTTPVRPNRELSFQGRLTDTAQNPITTASNMAFRLYDTGPGTGGTLLWDSSTCSVTPDQDGIFNVGLGDDCGAEISENVFTENSNVWLEVDVVSETLTPRQSIKTVAYAINSETVQGYPVSATGAATTNTILVMDSAGQVLLGEVSPTLKSTNGTFSIEAQALILQTSSGSNGDIILDPDGTGEVLSTSYFYAPGATFAATYAGGTSLVLKGGPSGTGNIQEWQDSSGTVLSVVDENGNLGIGTGTPQGLLHINGTVGSLDQGLVFGDGDTGWYEHADDYLRLDTNSSTTIIAGTAYTNIYSARLGLPNGSETTPGLGFKDDTDNGIYRPTTNELGIVTAGSEALRVDSSGNVGIGTTYPLFLLDVAGTASVNSLNINDTYTFPTVDGSVDYILQTDGAGAVSWEDPSAITGAGLWANTLNLFHPKNELASVVDLALGGTSTASANIHLMADGQAYFAGNVGVGTTVPGANLEVYETGANATFNLTRDSGATIQGIASTTWASLGTSGGQTFALRSNGTDRISLDTNGDISFNSGDVFFENSSGNVGIGTTAPGALFEVNGTENVAKARITSTSSGAQSYAQATGGLELTATGMNTTYKYTPIIKFGSTDPDLTTLNPKFLAGIAGYATETYDLDTRSGMGIEFFTTGMTQGASTTPTSRMVIDSAGNVGIGTTGPSEKLTIQDGNIELMDGVTSRLWLGHDAYNSWPESNSSRSSIFTTGASGSYPFNGFGNLVLHPRSDGQAGDIVFATGDTGDPSVKMTILNSGNVGIGTTAPGTLLHLKYATPSPTAATITSAQLRDIGLYIEDSSLDNVDGEITSGIAFGYGSTESNTGIFGVDEGASGIAGLGFATGNNTAIAERMRIDGNGNVGIGDPTPDAPLDVVGDVYISDGLSLYETAVSDGTVEATKFCTGDGETNCVTDFSSLGGGSSLFTDGGTITYLTSTTDDLALGGTGSTSPFFFDESAEILTLTNTTAGDSFRVNDVASDTTPFIIDADGNVGVGTTGPLAQLHIVQNQNDAIYNEMTAMGASDKRAFRTAITSNTSSAVNIYGLEVYDNNSIAGATVYGVYVNIDDPDTTNYGIYSAGGVNYFSDNVGIGTSSPTKTLDVVGNTLITPDTGGVVIDQNNNNIALSVKGGGSGINIAQFIRDVGATANINLSGSGGEPQIVFDTVESSSPWAIGVDDGAESFNIAQNSAIGTNDFFTILTSGNVGIGTTSPAQKLTISEGDIQIDHTTFANQDGIIYKGSSLFIHNFNYGDNGTVTTSGANTFIGSNAGNLTMGSTATLAWESSFNTGVGYNSLSNLTTGFGNTGLGYATLNLTTTGAANTAIGDYSLRNSTGNNNSTLGRYSLINITSGSNNTSLGTYSGRYESDGSTSLTSLSNSVIIGYNAKANASGDTNEIAIGYDVTGLGSNTAVLGNSSITTTALRGNVGIGTTAPNAPLEINNATSMALNITGTPASDWDHGLWLDGKAAVTEGGDSGWLRLNNNSSFTSGVYTPGTLRVNGSLLIGDDEGFYRLGEDLIGTIDNNDALRLPNLLIDTSTIINDSAITINDANRYIWTPSSGWGEYWNTTDNAIEFYGNGGGNQVAEIDLDNGYIYGERFLDNSNSSYFLDPAKGDISLIVAGNVGIGTTSPSQILDVVGNVEINGHTFFEDYTYNPRGIQGTYFGNSDSADDKWNKLATVTLPSTYDHNHGQVEIMSRYKRFIVEWEFSQGNPYNAGKAQYVYRYNFNNGESLDVAYTEKDTGSTMEYEIWVKSDAWDSLNYNALSINNYSGTSIAWHEDTDTRQEAKPAITDGYDAVTDVEFALNLTENIYTSGNVGIGTTSPSQALDVVGNITTSGQLQVGGYASTPTAIGEGTMIFNTTTNTHQCYNGTSWYNCGGTLYSNTNASVASGSYITVNHDLASTDLLSNAWINSQSTWKMLDANYQPAIAWEGKDTQKGTYRNAVNSYSVGNETGADTSTLHDGYLFDTFEDETKTDDTNTTVSIATQQGDDGSSNFTTLDQRVQDGRVGLAGGQTMSTATTDNAGNTYLGSDAVNDIYYYDRARDSIPEVQVELGIDPNWYNGVTLSVATSSATFSQNSTVPDVNPNLTTTYNGSLIKASGRYSSGGQTIFATIKSPTTYDWTDYNGEAATGVSIDPGTSQALGATGVSLTFTGTNYNVGDVFKVASWFVETTGSTRGGKQQFPERSNVVATTSSVDIIDMDSQKLWMRFDAGTTHTNMFRSSGISAVEMLNGKLYGSIPATSLDGLVSVNFSKDSTRLHLTFGRYTHSKSISERDSGEWNLTSDEMKIVGTNVNDVSAAVIPNQPTQEMTVSGWGYIEGDGTDQIEETVTLPYKFESIPNITVSSAGYYSNGGPTPTSLLDCNGTALSNDGSNTQSSDITTNNFQLNHGRYIGTFSATAYFCYTWTATGTVSPKQFVAVATDGGTTVINETDNSSIDSNSTTAKNGVHLTSNGNLYETKTAGSAEIFAHHGIPGLSDSFVFQNEYSASTIPAVVTSTQTPTSLYVTEETSTIDNQSNTIYFGSALGVSVIQEKQSDGNAGDGSEEDGGSIKYYTKDYISEEMVGDIRGMWPLNGNNTASDFEDVSVKANNLTGTNITSADAVSGVRGEAYDFDGSTEYLSCTDASCGGTSGLDMGTADFTIGAWIKTSTTGLTQTIVRKASSASDGYFLRVNTSNKIEMNYSDGVTSNTTTSSITVTDGQWHHVLGVADRDNGVSVYIDGQLDNFTSFSNSGSVDNIYNFGIGYNGLASPGALFNGTIDEPFVTATAISAQKIKQMYEVGSRALESHSLDLGGSIGLGSEVDNNQKLGATSNLIGAVMPDKNNQYMYVASQGLNTSAVSRIQLNSDTNMKTYFTYSSNKPSGGTQISSFNNITSLAVSNHLEAVGSYGDGVQTMGFDDYSTATTGNFVSKTTTLPNNIGSAVLWVSPILDSDDGSNTVTVKASNDNGSTYDTCTLVETDSNHAVAEKEYACTFTAGGNQLKVKFEFARGSTKTNTYITQYGISWLGETGFRIEQADNNNVRLYNYSGETQNLKLNVTGAGTATLATPWTDGGSYLYATGYETLRIYDGGGTNYVSLSHDGTVGNIGIDGSTSMSFDSSGNVGIGTTSPSQALDIIDNGGGVNDSSFAEFNSRSLFGYDGSRTAAQIQASTAKHIVFDTNGANERMRITSDGNIGIGTTSPGAKLQIVDSSNDLQVTYGGGTRDIYSQISTGAGTNTLWRAQNIGGVNRFGFANDAMYIKSGNVGIGTTSPAFKLDVAGKTRFGTTSLTDSAAFHFSHGTLTTGQVSMYIDVQDTGVSNEYFMQLIRGNASDNEFLFRTDGTAHADGSFTGGGADVAEYYYLQDSTEEGDLVSIPTTINSDFPAGKTLEKSSGSSYDGSVIGIVSTNPGLVAGGGNAEIDNTYTNQKPIALAGRVPVKVSVENGEIKKGDPLTSSSTPGVAMKASSAGQIIGRALEDYDGTQQISDGVLIVENERLETFTYSDPIPSPNEGIGKIMTFVNTTYHDPNIYLTDTGNLIINKNPDTDQYLVTDTLTNNLIDTVGIFAKAVIANIQAGLITAKQISSEELISPIINTSKINTASSVTISRNTNLESEDPVLVVDGSFTAGKTSLTSLLTQEATISGTITTTHLEATSSRIAALEVGMAELENIKATTAEIVNATISGTLYASNIYDFETQIANSLQTPGLLDLITGQNESTASANYLAELYETTNSSGFEAIAMADLDLTLDELSLTETDVVLTGSALFIEKYFKVNGAGYISDSLAVGNSIFAGNAVVVGSGDSTTQISNGIIAYTTPNPNDQILKIQPTGLGSIELLAGLVTLDDSGLVTVNGNFETTGNAKIGGTLLTDLIQPSSFDNPFQVQVAGIDTESGEVKESRFEIINEVGTPVATFSAQGSAKFAGTVEVEGGISIGSENLGASAINELETNKTAGTAIITSGASQVKIDSSLVTSETMIYVTAVGSTNNQVMFVKSQLPHLIVTTEYTQGDVIPPLSTVIPATGSEPAMLKTITQQGEFTVGFDNVTVGEVSFNWWIVN